MEEKQMEASAHRKRQEKEKGAVSNRVDSVKAVATLHPQTQRTITGALRVRHNSKRALPLGARTAK